MRYGFVLILFLSVFSAQAKVGYKVGNTAPGFTLKTLDKVAYSLSALRKKGPNDELAVSLRRVIHVVVLMIAFRLVELHGRADLCHDWILPHARSVQLLFAFLSLRFLLFVVVENHRTVLCAYIVPLAIKRGRIVR